MFLERGEQEESFSENDFKELDNEIEKVIRGESSLYEETNRNKITETNQLPNLPKNMNEFRDKKDGNSKDLNENIGDKSNKMNHINDILYQNNNLDALDIKNKNRNCEKNTQNFDKNSNTLFSLQLILITSNLIILISILIISLIITLMKIKFKIKIKIRIIIYLINQ